MDEIIFREIHLNYKSNIDFDTRTEHNHAPLFSIKYQDVPFAYNSITLIILSDRCLSATISQQTPFD